MISKQQNCNGNFRFKSFFGWWRRCMIAKQNLVWTLYEIDFVVLIVSTKLKLFTLLSGASSLVKGNESNNAAFKANFVNFWRTWGSPWRLKFRRQSRQWNFQFKHHPRSQEYWECTSISIHLIPSSSDYTNCRSTITFGQIC